MVTITNKVVSEDKKEKAQVYSDLVEKEMTSFNDDLQTWFDKQSFVNKDVIYAAESVEISSNIRPMFNSDTDRLSFQINFEEGKSAKKAPLEPVIHENETRAPSKPVYGSSFKVSLASSGHINFNITYGDHKGWIEKGEFPKGPAIKIDKDMEISAEKVTTKTTRTPIFVDVKRNIKAGLSTALDFAKYRAMALASSDFYRTYIEQMKLSNDPVWGEHNRPREFVEKSSALWLKVLPDVIPRSGSSKLKTYYEPGYLETVVATQLVWGVSPRDSFDLSKPFSYFPSASPIKIQHKGGKSFDATVDVLVKSRLQDDIEMKKIVENYLNDHFPVKAHPESGQYAISIPIVDAHSVIEQIKEGDYNTSLHKSIDMITKGFELLHKTSRGWNDAESAIRKSHEASINATRNTYFESDLNNFDFWITR